MALTKASLIDLNGQELILDADADTSITTDTDDQIDIKIGGTDVMQFTNSSSDFVFKNPVQDKDIIFKGNDGGSEIDAITIDMSAAGRTTFHGDVIMARYLEHEGDSDTFIGFPSADTFVINTGGSERVRVTSDGKVGIGTSSPEYLFHASTSGAGTNFKFQTAGGGDTLYIDLTTSGGTGFIGKAGSSLEFYPQGTISVEFANAGNAKCVGSFLSNQSLSDMRLKEDVKPITNALHKVEQLQGLTWKYKKDGTVNTGLSADKLIEILPEAVGEDTLIGDDNGEKYKHINYGNTVGLLVEAIKELKQELTIKVEELENKINE